jgi:hypothetical protein
MLVVSTMREDQILAEAQFTGIVWHSECAPLDDGERRAV